MSFSEGRNWFFTNVANWGLSSIFVHCSYIWLSIWLFVSHFQMKSKKMETQNLVVWWTHSKKWPQGALAPKNTSVLQSFSHILLFAFFVFQNPREVSSRLWIFLISLVYVCIYVCMYLFIYECICVTCPGQTKNDTDLEFGTHTSLDHI